MLVVDLFYRLPSNRPLLSHTLITACHVGAMRVLSPSLTDIWHALAANLPFCRLLNHPVGLLFVSVRVLLTTLQGDYFAGPIRRRAPLPTLGFIFTAIYALFKHPYPILFALDLARSS